MSCIGKVLGNRYEILEEIGSGGMATVYKAKDKILNRFVALKILKDEFANDVEFIKRFQVEAQSAASLSHPNIVSIYDVGFEAGMHYIVMELVSGKTLKDIIKEKGKLPWREAVGIASQIASGLSQAHQNHIIHRDIKPHNILITKDGVAKVTDFGIAKAVSSSTINAFDTTMGSVHYFSPEHARGGYTDEKSDIYSLGVVLYEMCTGSLPFDAKTPVAIALMHINEKPAEPIELCNTIPQGVNDIILKAMQKETSERYASASDMYKDLQKILSDPSIKVAEKEEKFSSDFPTQKIPIVKVPSQENQKGETISMVNHKEEQDEEKMSKKKKNSNSKPRALLKLFLFLAILCGLAIGSIKIGKWAGETILGTPSETKEVFVPNLTGSSEKFARELLAECGLEIGEINHINDDTQAEGFIVRQSPKSGDSRKRGAKVDIWISLGNKTTTVPDISAQTSPNLAKTLVEAAGLVYAESGEASNIIESGKVIRQKPVGGEIVPEGSTVVVFVSTGPENEGLIKVPSVVDSMEADARKTLDSLKLIPVVEYTYGSTKKAGSVIEQIPAAGNMVSELSEVKLIVMKYGSGENEEKTPTPAVKTPTAVPTSEKTPSVTDGKKPIDIDLSSRAENDTVMVKVVLEGQTLGKKTEYQAKHSRSEGKIRVYVTDMPGAMLKVFFDDTLIYEYLM